MRSFKSLWLMVTVSGLIAGIGSRSFAGPLLPPLSPVTPTAGETGMVSVIPGFGGVLVGRVDWFVLPPGDYTGTVFEPLVSAIFGILPPQPVIADTYIYAYQIEALINDLEDLTVNVAGPYLAAYQSYLDLDEVGHDPATFPNLGAPPAPAETEFAQQPLQWVTYGPVLKTDNVTWDFDGYLDAGEESEVLWILSNMPPTYKFSYLGNGLPSPGIGLLCVPSPEPATVVLLMMGVLGLGIAGRCRRKA